MLKLIVLFVAFAIVGLFLISVAVDHVDTCLGNDLAMNMLLGGTLHHCSVEELYVQFSKNISSQLQDNNSDKVFCFTLYLEL
eukprot:5012901-Amphidinium_carterae.1